MRRDMEWKAEHDDGTHYEVRVSCFAKNYRFQFKERGATAWDYAREPSIVDLEQLCNTVRRRRQRRQASDEDLVRAERMLAIARQA